MAKALRETYEGIWVTGDPLLDRSVLEDRIARVNKLYLNGWDDLNGDHAAREPPVDHRRSVPRDRDRNDPAFLRLRAQILEMLHFGGQGGE